MIFDNNRRHFFRYETAEDAPNNPSTPDHMSARCRDTVTRQPVQKGDVVWAPAATQTAPLVATQTAPPGRGELTH